MPADLKIQKVAARVCAAKSWTLGPEVGAGAFKHTFEVRLTDGSERALKVYKRTGADARASREVDAIKRCTHAGVARFDLIEAWKDEGADEYIYSLEEFLAGGTLTDRLKGGTLPVAEIRLLAMHLVDAVSHIASLDLVHRDLKPDNIMFRTAGGPPVIVDFGLVRDLGQSSLTKTWMPHGPGTPYYAPPEQLNNEKPLIDWRADQFSLGVVLTMCGLGRHPYALPGFNQVEVVDRVARREAPAQEFAVWAASNALDPLVQMVAPWPILRFRTALMLSSAWLSIGKVP
jgi:serine/threonine protein kinase